MSVRAKVTSAGRMSLPAEIRKRHGLAHGGEVMVDDAGDAIILRTVDQVVGRAQALARGLAVGKPGSTVDDFLAERHSAAANE